MEIKKNYGSTAFYNLSNIEAGTVFAFADSNELYIRVRNEESFNYDSNIIRYADLQSGELHALYVGSFDADPVVRIAKGVFVCDGFVSAEEYIASEEESIALEYIAS